MKAQIWLLVVTLVQLCHSYLDIMLNINRTSDHVYYTLPVKISNIDYQLAISVQNNKEYVKPIADKTSTKKKKKHKQQQKQLTGIIKALSIQGYTLEGWKRFFQQAFLFIQSHYYHQIPINLSSFPQSDGPKDGLITFGPNLSENNFFQLLKQNSPYITEDVVSIYRKPSDSNARIQLGGMEKDYAKGHRDGYLFYSVPMEQINGKWGIPIGGIMCTRKGSGSKSDTFKIANSGDVYAISLESPIIRLPYSLAIDIERNFQTQHSSCRITPSNRLACRNVSTINLMLYQLNFLINEGAFINISLYNLLPVQQGQQKQQQTVLNIEFTQNKQQLQIGQPLFRGYYISLDMGNKKMIYSPVNHFPNPSYGVYIIRFIVGFCLFTVVVGLFTAIWQVCSDPFTRNKIKLDSRGIEVVQYSMPLETYQDHS